MDCDEEELAVDDDEDEVYLPHVDDMTTPITNSNTNGNTSIIVAVDEEDLALSVSFSLLIVDEAIVMVDGSDAAFDKGLPDMIPIYFSFREHDNYYNFYNLFSSKTFSNLKEI